MNKKNSALNTNILIILPVSNFNEIEYKTIRLFLENAGSRIFIASDTGELCTGQFSLKVKPDILFNNVNENNFNALVLIGGAGARKYWNNSALHSIAVKFYSNKKPVAAICSAPVTLAKSGILSGGSAACFYEDKAELINAGINYKDVPIVVYDKIITANGPASSQQLAQTILYFLTKEKY